MKILEYDDVDPLQVLNLTLLASNFVITPEHAAHIRLTDPRPFPCFTVNAVKDNVVVGQAGVYRLPMVSMEGREDVGGIWAVSIHPQYAEGGIASTLLEEAHNRMREAGLRFSILGTNRDRRVYEFYRQQGYEETNTFSSAFSRWEIAHQPTRLRAQPVGTEGYDFVEKVFADVAKDYLGFAWRHTPFENLRKVNINDIWILSENNNIVGYAFAQANQTLLTISNFVIKPEIDAAEAIAAVASQQKSMYIQVKSSRPSEIISFQRAGYQITCPTWDSFMVKPLLPDLIIDDARQLFGIGTDKFLISWLDVTYNQLI